jgi:hypothetical protein
MHENFKIFVCKYSLALHLQRPQDVRTRSTTPRTSTGRHAVRHPTRRTATQLPVARSDRRLDGGQPGGPLYLGRPPGAVLKGPSARGRPPRALRPVETLEPHNYWSRSPIQACDTILECASDALQHGLLKKLLKEFFSQDTVPLAVRCFNVACGSVSCEKNSFHRLFL